MTRQSFQQSRSPQEALAPTEPIDMIPTAKDAKRSRAKRNRQWEERPEHHARSYRVSDHLRTLVGEKDAEAGMQYDIRAVADEYTSTVSEVARNMMEFALSEVRAGKLEFTSHAKPEGRKMRLAWSFREDAWPREVRPPRKKKEKEATSPFASKPIFLAYRWGNDIDRQIKELASTVGVTSGELVVYLLLHAIKAYKAGQLHLHGIPGTINQRLTSSW